MTIVAAAITARSSVLEVLVIAPILVARPDPKTVVYLDLCATRAVDQPLKDVGRGAGLRAGSVVGQETRRTTAAAIASAVTPSVYRCCHANGLIPARRWSVV